MGSIKGLRLLVLDLRLAGAVVGLGLLRGAQRHGQGLGVNALALGQVGGGAAVAPGVARPGATGSQRSHREQPPDGGGDQALVGGHDSLWRKRR